MNKGLIFAAGSYTLWGFFPIYFHWLNGVPALQVLSHRIVWSLLLMVLVISFQRNWQKLLSAFTWKVMLIYLCAGVLLAINWGTYVWAVNAGYVIETSLGYFINPLLSVLLGVVFLREQLRPLQWIPVGLAAAGVTYLTIHYGALPWIALVLALSFGLYGLIKKLAPLNSVFGLTLETAIIFLPALGYLILMEAKSLGSFGHSTLNISLLLALAGVVTVIPLLLFSEGARRIPLSVLGLMQYIAPTLQLLTGIFIFKESFTLDRGIGFAFIWVALGMFTIEGLLRKRFPPVNPD
jgi:chloramphenicol-sensitive protein RarD